MVGRTPAVWWFPSSQFGITRQELDLLLKRKSKNYLTVYHRLRNIEICCRNGLMMNFFGPFPLPPTTDWGNHVWTWIFFFVYCQDYSPVFFVLPVILSVVVYESFFFRSWNPFSFNLYTPSVCRPWWTREFIFSTLITYNSFVRCQFHFLHSFTYTCYT